MQAAPDDEVLLDEIFDLAVQRHAAGEAVDLEKLLADREHLRDRALQVVAMAHDIAVAGPSRPRAKLPELAGYTILHEVGAGGGGVVYRAHQQSIGRDVALKVLPPAMLLSSSARERFLAEARALGRVRDPHIVAVHDVIAEREVHALAMEWIDGTTLARVLTDPAKRLGVRAITEMGATLARALAAAHAAGLVHRDVKPSNVMLRADGSPVLIDFGLVRDAENSLHTKTGEFLGTMAYAAPEQLRGDHGQVGEWTDVYGLGATLYAALAGKPPFGAASPSVMLAHIEHGQATPLQRLNPQVPRDLATVLAKAMDKEPSRRYPTAIALAEDLERFLAHQPILARPSSVALRLQRWLERSPSLALALAGLLLTLMAGLAAAIWLSLGLAEQTRAARESEAKARTESEMQTQYADFLREVVQYGDAALAKGRAEITVADAIERASQERLRRPGPVQPEAEATIRVRIAELLVSVGRSGLAEQLLAQPLEVRRSAFGPDSREVAEVVQLLARAMRKNGNLADAEPLLRDAVRIRRHLLLADPEQGPWLAQALTSHGIALRYLGRLAEAETAYVEALGLYRRYVGENDENVSIVLTTLANLLSQTGRLGQAADYAQQALAMVSKFHAGAPHLDVASAHVCLGRILALQGRVDDGLGEMRVGWQMAYDLVGDRHDRCASYAMTLGTHLVKYGRYADAEPLLRRSHAAYVALESASFAAEAAVALAEALLGLAREVDVESLLAPLLDKAPAPHDVALRRRLATARVRMARFADAEPLLQAAWDGLPDGAERRAVAGEMVLLLEAWARVAPDPARDANLQSWRSRAGS